MPKPKPKLLRGWFRNLYWIFGKCFTSALVLCEYFGFVGAIYTYGGPLPFILYKFYTFRIPGGFATASQTRC